MFRVELRDIMMNGRRIKFSATCHALVYGMISHSATITHYHIFSSFGVFNLWFNHWVRYINVAMLQFQVFIEVLNSGGWYLLMYLILRQ